MRISRLNAVHQLLDRNTALDLTSVAHHCGYADQSHFIRDFKSFTGERPGLFIKNESEYIVNAHSADMVGRPDD